MSRDFRLYLEDVIEAITKIRGYTAGLSFEQFSTDAKVVDAVTRNLEVIGEAVRNIPGEVREKHASIEWRKIAGLRDILIHAYFGIDVEILWDIVDNDLAPLEEAIRGLLSS
jgi:uncharacterized protein with HEPN domain